MSILQVRQSIIEQLTPLYGNREAMLIADMLLEKIADLPKRALLNLKTADLSPENQIALNAMLSQLLRHRPIQYVLGEAWFQNMRFYVDERVLIPRPETEELVEWVVREEKSGLSTTILDIGSGSGCIPLSIAKKLPNAVIHSCDISMGALEVARKNASDLGLKVNWHHIDFLQEAEWLKLPKADVLVSNPPYIPQSGRSEMATHVVDYEPSMALFVPDEDPMVFYEAIARFARLHTSPGARIYVEIHEDLAENVRECFLRSGLRKIETRKDMQGKERMIRAISGL
ncbi:peptide chain release factor N(5)-glutamine methyltransferase [Flavihumibacter sp. ZG627]|uniref:peptide chain release factor N(5)-glutamine methyltransferase n=1 Tax=Flavihumibacter sp. ZG627 TaxID=1463156 RepID=UPI00057DD3F1|nr:peptide chain release factor N(5)-glutamine methyltransferase [Flavihumibacter sp. ZG627]KIC89347.1 hypothetical protein HY58_17170 [Flavihumibacter sp. ZG627]